jgi:SP family arabinose:H+ symporter-like MFS transporter
MAIVTGILLAYLANWLLSFSGPSSWRWMFAVAAVPSIAFLIGLFFVPESPRWLVEMNRSPEALAILSKINGPTIATHELNEIEQTVAQESGSLAELFQPGLRRALWIAVALAILQQVTGINTVLFYGSIIFKQQVHSGSDTAAIFANVIVGLVNFFATLVALNMIDKLGRRPLLLVSSGVMGLCQVGTAAVFLLHNPPPLLVLSIMLVCVASFAIGLGPGVWVLIAEFFPTRIRGRAMSIATLFLWAACTLLTMTFLSLAKALTPSGAFLIYAFMCAITFFLVLRSVPETKGRTLEQIEHLWK